MEQDDRSYHSADRSPRSYAYAGQPHHVRGAPQTYYELAQLMEQSLSTHYPESSQRSITHSTPYTSTYDPSPFRGQSYGLPDSQIHNSPFQRASLNNPRPHGLDPFSDLALEANPSTLRTQMELYRSSSPSTAEVDRAYVPDAAYITASTDHFAFTSVPSSGYMQIIQPSVSSAPGPVADRHLLGRSEMPHAQYTGNLGQTFTPRQLPFDQKHMYTSKANASDVAATDSPIKLANLDDPRPSLSASHQYSNSGTNVPLSEDTVPPPVAIPKKKKSKMHDCEICHKKFPR